jgi:copper homeostasis protein
MVMIRPRSGDFYFSVREIDIMVQQIKNAAKFGANGVVLGVLNQSDNTINSMGLNCLIEECKHRNLKVTFHRAFDAVADHVKALETLVDLKINRILTSGTRWGSNKTAVEGIKRLSEIINASRQRIEIVVGGGINYKNITQILSAIPIIGNNISVHTYSGVLINGMVDLQEVKKLVGIVEKF